MSIESVDLDQTNGCSDTDALLSDQGISQLWLKGSGGGVHKQAVTVFIYTY